ncbi:MAG: DinB family protein, partial [Bacteroidetes bacterium]|nr:DinB family protein [Bacteroidota bacterium]
MTPDLFVKMSLDAWNQQLQRMNKTFSNFTDEELQLEVAPGRNRVIYLLGHMAAVHDRMLPLLGLGDRFYPQLDEAFIANPDKTI